MRKSQVPRGMLQHRMPQRGMTLIELLVVISIMVMLFAVLVPRVRPALDEARIREGARQLNAYLASAQALAVQRGVPVSVSFIRAPNNNNFCFQAQMAESLPILAGNSEYSVCTINASNNEVTFNPPLDSPPAPPAGGLAPPSPIMPGDQIRFNFRSTLYEIAAVNLANAGGPQITLANNPSLPALPVGPVSFQIVRLPIRPTNNAEFRQGSTLTPLQLPRGICVDMGKSGSRQFVSPSNQTVMVDHHFHGADRRDPAVVFTPSGQVLLWFSPAPNVGSSLFPLVGSIYFCVGKVEKVWEYDASGNPVAGSQPGNEADIATRWVSVRARTGQTITVDNFASGTDLLQNRRYAASGSRMGGK